AGLLADLHADRGRAGQAGGAAAFLHRVLAAADVAEGDHRPVGAVRDHDAVEVLDVADPAHRAHRHVGRSGRELAAGYLHVLPLDGIPNLVHGETVGVEPVGVQQQLNLALALAVVADRADVLHRLEILLDALLGDLGDFLRRARAVDGESEDRLRVRIHLGDLHRTGVARELADNLRQLVADVLGRRLDLALQREGDRDTRVALIGRGAELVDAADRIHRLFDALGDLGFDLFGARAGQ